MIHCAGMACDLATLTAAPPQPKGVRIEQADGPVSLHPLTTERRRRRHEGQRIMASLEPRRVWHFVARLDEQVVGETALCAGADVAGIYDVEVLDKFRRRGIGTALVFAAVRHAKELGHSAAVLGATGMGFGVYARVAFREVCKLSFWKYGKMRQL
jgi:GNAT superfamily N-acetyltransferase